MEKVKHKLTVGKENAGLDLYCSLKMDGKEVQRFRSRSFLGSFAWMLQALMHGGRAPKIQYISRVADGNMDRSMNTIVSQTTDTPVRIEVNNASPHPTDGFRDKDDEYPSWVIINNTENSNGIYRGVKISKLVIELYHLDGTPVDGSDHNFVGGYSNPSIGYDDKSMRDGRSFWKYREYFQNWQIIVGKSNKEVRVDDMYLWDRILFGSEEGKLSHGNVSVSSLTTDKPTSRFTISKPFTNNGTETIEIKEVGIINGTFFNEDANTNGYAIVRDSLESPLSVPSGKTLTVDYELVIRLTPDTQDTDVDGTNGGFLQEFMNRIRFISQSGSTSRSAYFSCASSPGKGSYANDEHYRPDQFGIRLGDDNQFASMTDEKLNLNDSARNGYEHGENDGELYHYGTDVGLVQYDFQSNKAVYEITRIFENRGSVDIPVKEIGLFANINTSFSMDELEPAIIARTALHPDDQFTIAPGEFKQVVYEVEVIA